MLMIAPLAALLAVFVSYPDRLRRQWILDGAADNRDADAERIGEGAAALVSSTCGRTSFRRHVRRRSTGVRTGPAARTTTTRLQSYRAAEVFAGQPGRA